MARVKCESLAVIPARSGSKGLPGKNIKELCNKPLIAWTIEAALNSGRFDKVLVSTDSKEYGGIAEAWGSEVAYRDPDLATSTATTFMVLEDLLRNEIWPTKYLTLLQPTSPLRTAHHINEAMDLMASNAGRYDFTVSMSVAPHSSDLIHPLGPNNSLAYFDLDYSNYRRQDGVEYTPNGAIFVAKPASYLEQGHFFGPRALAYLMDKVSSIDIDDEIDFALAELCMERQMLKRSDND